MYLNACDSNKKGMQRLQRLFQNFESFIHIPTHISNSGVTRDRYMGAEQALEARSRMNTHPTAIAGAKKCSRAAGGFNTAVTSRAPAMQPQTGRGKIVARENFVGGYFATFGIPKAPNCLTHTLMRKPMLGFRGKQICKSRPLKAAVVHNI